MATRAEGNVLGGPGGIPPIVHDEPGGALQLPPVNPPGGTELPEELQEAWTTYMVNGFRHNEAMFQHTLAAFMRPYRLTVWMYVALFAIGIGLFVAAVIVGLTGGQSVVAIAFGGLGAGVFVAFFLRQPLHALEENLEFITWLGVAFNTYWTRLMYMMDQETVQKDLKAAERDFTKTVERLIVKHAELRRGRPGGEPEPKPADNEGGESKE